MMKVLMLILHHYHVTFPFIFPIVLGSKSYICSFEICVINKRQLCFTLPAENLDKYSLFKDISPDLSKLSSNLLLG